MGSRWWSFPECRFESLVQGCTRPGAGFAQRYPGGSRAPDRESARAGQTRQTKETRSRARKAFSRAVSPLHTETTSKKMRARPARLNIFRPLGVARVTKSGNGQTQPQLNCIDLNRTTRAHCFDRPAEHSFANFQPGANQFRKKEMRGRPLNRHSLCHLCGLTYRSVSEKSTYLKIPWPRQNSEALHFKKSPEPAFWHRAI
jgi:hypothetical protein